MPSPVPHDAFDGANRAPWLLPALLAALLALAAPAAAQGRVSGRVLDRDQGTPVSLATVRLTSGAGAAVSGSTDAQGRYSLALPAGGGPYALRAERIGYVALTVVIPADEAAGGAVWRDVRLSAQAVALAGVAARQSRRDRAEVPRRDPGGNDDTRVSWLATNVPLDPGDLAALAGLQPGVQAADGGVSFFAQDPSQTRTTLDGASFGSTSLPQEAIASTSVVGSTYDVSRGQFSGGLISATTLAGTNLFGGAFRSRFSHPGLQWQAARPPAGRPESSFGYVDAGVGGAILPNRLFWYAALSASRRSTPLVSFENAAPAVLEGMGVHPDSAARLAALLRDGGIAPGGGLGRDGVNDAASALLRLDFDVSDQHSLMVRLDGRHARLEGLGVGPLATLGSGGTARDQGGGAMAQLTSRIGAVNNELRVYRAGESRRLRPERPGPAGVVRVPAADGEGAGSSVLRFGGSLFHAASDGSLLEVSDQASAELGAHEVKAGFLVSAEEASAASGGNRYGTFTFNSLDDFRAGRPALFTRTLGEPSGEARARHAALYLGDVWRRGRLAVTFGARLEGRWYPSADGGAAEGALPLGARPGRVPSEWGVSPRLGWSYDGEGWFLFGGAGEFRGSLPMQPLAAVLGENGAGSERALACVGAAAPAPEWARYADDPDAVPAECPGGDAIFAGRTPSLTTFADDFAAPRAWRASVGGTVPLLHFFRVNFDASFTRGISQTVARDLNLPAGPAFALAAEGGRPVYAPAAAIDPATGGVAPGSRPFAEWGAVREMGAEGRSSTLQARMDVAFYPRAGLGARTPRLSGSYVFTRARNEVGGLAALGGGIPFAVDPARLAGGTSDLERRHEMQVRLTWSPVVWARIGVLGRMTSGAPFTPRVDGDVNGDGAFNDPAFVFDPSAASDTALAGGMERLLADAPGPVRECLRAQLGRVAGRNSCRSGWTPSLDLRGDFQFWRTGVTRRLRLSVSTSNALGLVDRVVHGRDGLKGWGEPPLVDPVLLRVRGFDPAARAFAYEVNPSFGTRNAALARFRRPFALTLEGRITVGSDPAYQSLQKLVNRSLGAGRSAEEIRHELSRRIPNLPAQVATLDSAGALGLSGAQRAALAERADSLGTLLAPLADSLAEALSGVESHRRNPRQAQREIDEHLGRIRAALDAELEVIRALLSAEQWERLPQALRDPVRQILPPRGLNAPVTIGGG